MNIQAITFNNKVNSFNKEKKLQKKQNYSTSNSIAKNSLQEALGRSQVVFRGTGNATKYGFHYVNENILGKIGEEITYNDKNGSLEYKAHTPQGVISQQMYFIPLKQTRVIISTDEDGNKTETRIMPHGTMTKITDSQDRQIYIQKNDRKGTIDTLETDWETGRKILTQKRPELNEDVIRVFTLEGEEVFEGDLVKERLEVEDNYFETRNIITGKLYSTEKYSNKGKDSIIIEYWLQDDNDNIKKETIIKKGIKTVISHDLNGLKRQVVKIDKLGAKTVEKYAPDGMTKVEKFKKYYNKEEGIAINTIYDPGSDLITSSTVIDEKNDSYTTYLYNSSPNVASSSETYQQNRLVRYCEYYITPKDKREIQKSITYLKGNKTIEENFSNLGKKHKTLAIWKENGIPYKTERYDEKTGILFERREIHPSQKGWFIISRFDDYDNHATLRLKRVMANKDTVAMNIYYYDNGKQVRKVQAFNPDRSYRVTCYDTKGKITFEAEYNPDKTLKELIYKADK